MPGLLGQILVCDLRTAEFIRLIAPAGRPALRMKFDPRSELLLVAGGPAGTATVYDATSGPQVAFLSVPCPESNRPTDLRIRLP